MIEIGVFGERESAIVPLGTVVTIKTGKTYVATSSAYSSLGEHRWTCSTSFRQLRDGKGYGPVRPLKAASIASVQ